MAWNGSDQTSKPGKYGKSSSGKRSAAAAPGGGASSFRGLLAALIVVAGAGVAYWWFALRPAPAPVAPPAPKPKPGAIVEVKPEFPTNRPAPRVEKPVAKKEPQLSERERQLKAIRDRYGNNIPDNLKPTVYYLENPPKQTFHPMRTRASIFKRYTDRQLASLLLITPGDSILRCPTYDERFDTQFKESLAEPIKIAEDDSAEDKEIKEALISVRDELSKRMDGGEKPSEIINNVYDSLYSLGQYKKELEKQLANVFDSKDYSDEDIKDFVTAANLMLEKKNLPRFEMPNLLMRQIQLERAELKRRARENNKE